MYSPITVYSTVNEIILKNNITYSGVICCIVMGRRRLNEKGRDAEVDVCPRATLRNGSGCIRIEDGKFIGC